MRIGAAVLGAGLAMLAGGFSPAEAGPRFVPGYRVVQSHGVRLRVGIVRGTRPAFPRCYDTAPWFCGPRYAALLPPAVPLDGSNLEGLPDYRQVAAPARGYRYAGRHRATRHAVIRVRG